MSKISDYFYEVELKQQTPIVHFQYNQKGVTLRASDFKPRFDAFLYEKNDYDLINKFDKNSSLSYKLSIEGDFKSFDESETKECFQKLYFANRINNNSRKKNRNGNQQKIQEEKGKKIMEMIFCEVIVTLRFFSYDKSLFKIFEKYLDEFLCQTNFGLRQSKGFGGFVKLGFQAKSFEEMYKNKELIFQDRNGDKCQVLKYKGDINKSGGVHNTIENVFEIISKEIINYKNQKKRRCKNDDFFIEKYNSKKNPNRDEIDRKPCPIMFKYIKPNLYAVFKGKPPKLDNKYWNDELGVRDYLNNGKNKRIWQDI